METIQVFPEISKEFYKGRDNGMQSDILGWFLRKETSLKVRQLESGWKLTRKDKLIRTLHLQKKAFECELKMQSTKADFFWEACYKSFEAIVTDVNLWSELEKEFDIKTSLRDAMMKELFIPTHIAFCNGYLDKAGDKAMTARLFLHLHYIRKLILFLDKAIHKQYLLDLACFELGVAETLKNVNESIKICEEICSIFPDAIFYCDRLTELVNNDALQNFVTEKHEHNAKVLRTAIERFHTYESFAGDYYFFYQRLGYLYYYYSISLANQKDLSNALLVARKAQSYYPEIKNFSQTWSALVDQMKQLQKYIGDLENEIRRNPNRRLSSEGLQMKAQAKKGFNVVNEYIEKSEPKIIEKRTVADLRALMNEIGIFRSLGDDWIDTANIINGIINEFIRDESRDVLSAQLKWYAVIDKHPQLQNLPPEKILSFIRSVKNGVWPRDENLNPPVIKNTKYVSIRIDTENKPFNKQEVPFAYWLYSSKDILTKLVAAAALIMAISTLGITIHKFYSDQKRDAAYQQVVKLVDQEAPHQVILDQANIFLDNLPLLGEDKRLKNIVGTYKEELAKWFIEDEYVDKQVLTPYLQRVKEMSKFNI